MENENTVRRFSSHNNNMVILENETLKASIHPMGAELRTLYHKAFNLDYLWNGNPDFWPRHSPVLFPIVGGLIEDSFLYKGKKYQLPKHGFARDSEFEIESSSGESASFILKSSEATLTNYPFQFSLRIKYRLESNKITVWYEVENPSNETIYFSIGTHPAFNVPLVKDTVYSDYCLEFEKTETSERHTLKGNLISGSEPYLKNKKRIDLSESLFYHDALIFTDLKSSEITLKTDKSDHGLRFCFNGFPYMGIWAAKDAPFVCIEPWCGIPDTQGHNQKIEEKEGIISLLPGNTWEKSWSLQCF